MSAHSPEPISMEFTRIRRRLDPDSVAWDATERVEERIAALAQENARLRLELDGFYTANGVVSDEDRKDAGWWGRACARLQSKATAAKEENARLREALQLIHDWRGLGDEDALTTWERIAEDFRRDTGYLRPGKDYAAASGFNDEAGQRKAWEAWCERKNAEVNTAIRTALRAGGAEKGVGT